MPVANTPYPARLLLTLLAILVSFSVIIWAAPHLGLTPVAARALAMVPTTLLLWIFSGLPQGLTAVLILIILPLLGVQDFNTSAGTLGQPFVWLLLSTFIVGQAVNRSSLGRRIALGLLHVARGNSAFSLLATMLSSLVLSILLPTSSGRTAVLAPICDGMARIMDDASDGQLGDPRRRGNLARSMFIALSFVSNATGVAVITGSSASTYAAGISPELFGYTWDYTSWAIVFLPGTVLFILLLWVGLLLLFRPEWHDVPGGVPYVAAARIALGPMNLPEWKTTLWLAAVVLGWITVPLHNLPIPMVAMMGTIGLCLPYLGVLTWEGAIRGVEWDVILMFCGGFSMALALESSGAATWIATSVADSLSHPTPLMAALALLAVSSLVRVAFVNMVAMMAMMLPVVVRIAAIWEISAVWLSLFAMVGVTFGFFLLSQTSSNAITYAYRRYSLGDLATAGTMALAISWVITLGLAFTLWPILGFHP